MPARRFCGHLAVRCRAVGVLIRFCVIDRPLGTQTSLHAGRGQLRLYENVECVFGLLRRGRPLRCTASGRKRLTDVCRLHTAVSLRLLAHQRCIPDMLAGLAVLIIAPVSTLLILPPRISALLLLANASITGPALAAHLAGGGLSSAPALCLAAATAVATGAVISLAAYLALVQRLEDAFEAWPWAAEQQRRLATRAPDALACPFTGAGVRTPPNERGRPSHQALGTVQGTSAVHGVQEDAFTQLLLAPAGAPYMGLREGCHRACACQVPP